MKHLESFELFENFMSIDDVFDKYYLNLIDKGVFKMLVKYDPTSKPNKLGKYSKWIVSLYLSESFKMEDLYKITEYLKLFHRFKHALPIEQRNIDNIKTLPELAEIVEPFKETLPELLSSKENKEAAFVKKFKEYDLYIPTTYEQSRDLGRGTEWCTAADSENGKKMFEKYSDKGGIIYFDI